MKAYKNILTVVAGLIISIGVSASNIIRTDAPIREGNSWSLGEPTVTEWALVGDMYDCRSQSPLSSTVPKGLKFTQTYSGCKQDQQRSVQKNQVNRHTGEIRAFGAPYDEVQSLTDRSGSREIPGTMVATSYTAEIVAGTLDLGPTSRGVGYRRQLGGVYTFGTSMTPFGAIPVATNFVLYAGVYSLTVIAGQEDVRGMGNIDTTAPRIFLSAFSRADLISDDGSVVFSYTLDNLNCSQGYCMKVVTISQADFNKWYAAPGLVKTVHLH